MITHEPVYIFSVERVEASEAENSMARQHAQAVFKARGVPFKIVTGYYKGQREQSYIVKERDADVVFQLSRMFKQESVLHLDAQRNASLVYLDSDTREDLGRWREVKAGPMPDAYTIDHETGTVWAAG